MVPAELVRQALSEIQHGETSEMANPVASCLQPMRRVTAHRSLRRKSTV